MLQTLVCSIFLRVAYFNPENVGLDGAIALNSVSAFIIFGVMLVADLSAFAIIEKLMKENFVLRDSTEKSFKQLLGMVDDHPDELVVVDQFFSIQFFNKKFFERIRARADGKVPRSCEDLIHADDKDEFTKKILEAIKDQKTIETSVNLNRESSDLVSDLKEGKKLMFSDIMEEYESVITPVYWKGAKAVMITMKSVQEQKVKNKLLENHANEISIQFQNIIQNLEDDLSFDSPKKNENFQMTSFKKSILMQVIKIFNEFL